MKAQAVPEIAALGSPQLAQAAAVTFAIEEFWRRGAGTGSNAFINRAAIAAQAFTAPDGIATVLDGFWGVWLVVVDDSNNVGVISQAPIMAFATEAIALQNCPKVRPFTGSNPAPLGRVAILTVNAVGGDFIAGTTNTNDGVVAAFNTAPQDGHVVELITGGTPRAYNAVLGQQLKDASDTAILQGRGSTGGVGPTTGANGDLLCLSVRSVGAPVLVGCNAVIEFRPWPSGGEGLGDASVSQNRPSFVP